MGRIVLYCAKQGAGEDSERAWKGGQGVHPGGGEHWSKAPRKSVHIPRGRTCQAEGPAWASREASLCRRAAALFIHGRIINISRVLVLLPVDPFWVMTQEGN